MKAGLVMGISRDARLHYKGQATEAYLLCLVLGECQTKRTGGVIEVMPMVRF